MENEVNKDSIRRPLEKRGTWFVWDDWHNNFIKEHLNEFTNMEFAQMFECSSTAVSFHISKLGIYRSKERISSLQKVHAQKLWSKMNAKPIEEKKEFCRKRNIATSKTCRELRKSELFRVNRLLVPQKTKWILKDSPKERQARYHLKKKYNYMVEKGSKVFYYDELTVRTDEEYYTKTYNFKFIEAID